MSLFSITDDTPAATKLAKGFLAEANQQFEQQLQAAYDAIERFWYRNRDEDGNPVLEGDEPTGIEILQAMGPAAGAVMAVAFARVQMLLGIQTALGIDVMDLAKVAAPYDLTFNPDGSLNTYTLKQ